MDHEEPLERAIAGLGLALGFGQQPNTGTFEGTVSYAIMNTVSQKGAGTLNSWLDADGYINSNDGEDVYIMLNNYQTGTSGIEVQYGDTDVLGDANVTVSPPRLDANTNSGVISWDETTYRWKQETLSWTDLTGAFDNIG